jgi:hypothetical protein
MLAAALLWPLLSLKPPPSLLLLVAQDQFQLAFS